MRSNIDVTLYTRRQRRVEDDGRGIPVGLHPEEQVPVGRDRLHPPACRRQVRQGSGRRLRFSGGLHGVGVSVTNALSTRLEVTVWRRRRRQPGPHHRLRQRRRGAAAEVAARRARATEAAARGSLRGPIRSTSTARRCRWPDLERLLRSKAVLLPGVKVTLTVEKTGEQSDLAVRAAACAATSRKSLARRLPGETVIPLFEGEQYAEAGARDFRRRRGRAVGGGLDRRRRAGARILRQPDPDLGRRHARSGLREGLFGAVKSFVELHSLLPKGVKLMPEDVFARASFVLSARGPRPAVPGPDQGTAELARRGAAGRRLRQAASSSCG